MYSVGADSKKGVIVIPEIFGIHGGRLKAICDRIAGAGFVVVMPDLMRGDSWAKHSSGDMTIPEWLKRFPWEKVSKDLTATVYPHLAAKGVESFGMMGFCWGSWVVLKASGTGKLSAGVSAHPSHSKIEPLWGGTEEKLFEAVQCPQLIMAAANDPDLHKPGGLDEKELKKKPFGDKCIVREFARQQHGWVPRGDISDAVIAEDVEAALSLTLEFFRTNL